MSHRPFGTDANGIIPEVGDFVAYNYSGCIATGTITKIGQRRTGRMIYYIEQFAPTEGRKSVVNGGAAVMLVLKKSDGVVKEFYTP
jgi:hypothetical protein